MSPLVLVVDDEPDVEVLFRQQSAGPARWPVHHGVCHSGSAAPDLIADAGELSEPSAQGWSWSLLWVA
jgi:hypothetical protein